MEERTTFKYWAFISYSQRDKAWADWLHPALEFYSIPRRLRAAVAPNASLPTRLFPIFRDSAELAGAPDLSDAIRQALLQSRHLIVICSPNAAASKWVNKEILTFQSLGRHNQIFCVIVDGEPNAPEALKQLECFPPALRADSMLDGVIVPRAEPLAVDLRPGRDSRRRALLRLLAGLLKVDFNLLWRRELRRTARRAMRKAATVAGAFLLAGLGYLAMADNGVPIPAGHAARLFLDRHAISLFRPVRAANEVFDTAARARAGLIDRLHREWTHATWIYESPNRTKGPKVAISPWVSSQAMSAVFRTVEARASTLPDFWRALDAPFAPELLIEEHGKKFGWLVGDSDYPQAEPALWTVAALAIALGRSDLVDSERRKHLLARLAYAQTVADLYRPLDDGGWNILPQQHDLTEHATYTSALALLALLELHAAGLGWHDDKARLDAMLRQTARWLMSRFDATASPPGWRLQLNETANIERGEIADGLTLQIYTTLLRAEAEAGVELPDTILQAIPQHLDRLIGRPLSYAPELGIIKRYFTNFDGSQAVRTVTENYLWHPWGIECAAHWLQRLRRTKAPAEDVTGARRTLGYLIVDLGSGFASAADGRAPTFVASELLYALGAVHAPTPTRDAHSRALPD